MSQNTFAALGVGADLSAALDARGITSPFQIQSRAIPPALAGTDLLAKSPTGSGKTLAFAIPLVERAPRDDARPAALVLVPTRELAVQVSEAIESLADVRGLRVATVYGGVALRPQANLARDAHVIVATPGRLQDLLDRRLVTLDAVEILVLDEADRMLDMGFKPQVDRIVKRLPRDRQTMFFSATLDGEVGELASAYTQSPARIEAELPSEHAPGEIEHRFVSVTTDTKVSTLVELLEAERGLALVFVRTKRGADRLARKLAQHGVKAAAMHGDLTQGQRQRALERFDSGVVTTLIATDVAARGLDLENVTHVINFDPPEDGKSYTHRVGRTGRA
ncbi:MAG TPA: DEAD/DEAH box helicase, partial [Gaiella sp.]|nr:DEAD/DEAH box helicase [Gaiella sp.]